RACAPPTKAAPVAHALMPTILPIISVYRTRRESSARDSASCQAGPNKWLSSQARTNKRASSQHSYLSVLLLKLICSNVTDYQVAKISPLGNCPFLFTH
uniref:Uncharacterized protein n=1 Tax=Crocodylus porosus TaxID=8502 RepID=A0A7M4DUY7_CROPO